MKIVVIIVLIFSSSLIKAQTNYISTGSWKYIEGKDTIEFLLKPSQIKVVDTTYPILFGFHKYIRNGVMVESSMNDANTDYADHKFTILIYNVQADDAKNTGDFEDLSWCVKRLIYLTKTTATTMNVRLTSMQVSKNINGYGYTLPRTFQLVKQ
jgi:hypothetical protein